jgi:hypothetical protein
MRGFVSSLCRTAHRCQFCCAARDGSFPGISFKYLDKYCSGCLQLTNLEHINYCGKVVYQALVVCASAGSNLPQHHSCVRASLDGGGLYFVVGQTNSQRRTPCSVFNPTRTHTFHIHGVDRATIKTENSKVHSSTCTSGSGARRITRRRVSAAAAIEASQDEVRQLVLMYRRAALPQKSSNSETASPPGVRRRLCLAVAGPFKIWAAPPVRALPRIQRGSSATP